MNIKILDSWLREYLKTDAKPKQIAEKLSLSSVSVERLEKYHNDWLYDIEITTNRTDLMSVTGLARETAAVLSANGIRAVFMPPHISKNFHFPNTKMISIKNDPKLVNRICAVVMEVQVKPSPKEITTRLESTDIRSLNNLIDITNYVMRTIGHPTHVFDFDRLNTKTLIIREAITGEQITTLDKKVVTLSGGDIVAENEHGEIVDLLGIMGLENSVVTNETKRILFFIDNNDPTAMRKTSMRLSIRSEAAVLNEKGIDPEAAYDALLYGIKLFEEYASGKILSELIDIYPNKSKIQKVSVSEQQINALIGVTIPLQKAASILGNLGFDVTIRNSNLDSVVPSFRANDIAIPEDLIEEIARIYGYQNIPSILPPLPPMISTKQNTTFLWENRVKDALKYWGFTEVYTYPMVSELLLEESPADAVTIANPLSEDMVYLRRTLTPSLLDVMKKNKNHDEVNLFEIANVYYKKDSKLPDEVVKLAGVIKKPTVSFYDVKGLIEQLLADLGITKISWKQSNEAENGAQLFLAKDHIGEIVIVDKHTYSFELDFQTLVNYATLHKTFKPLSKYPALVEDLAIIAPKEILTGNLMEIIQKQSDLIREVSLLDKYGETRTFHIIYQSYQKNLTDKEIGEIREKILKVLKEKYNARLKA